MITKTLLRALRNDLPMNATFTKLGNEAPPSKFSKGYFLFLCPHCKDMRAVVNPRNNLAHCFRCKKNTNNIDLLMLQGYDFLDAVADLEQWLSEYKQKTTNQEKKTESITER